MASTDSHEAPKKRRLSDPPTLSNQPKHVKIKTEPTTTHEQHQHHETTKPDQAPNVQSVITNQQNTQNTQQTAQDNDDYKFAPIILDRYQTSSSWAKSAIVKKSYSSFRSTLVGDEEAATRPVLSPYSQKLLKPFIFRDFESRPPYLRLLEEIVDYHHMDDLNYVAERHPIDYCYLRPSFIPQVNQLLRDSFWPGIDVSECIEYPDYTVVCLYKKKVIGCAFMTPDGYITYIVVHPQWRGAGIASFMLFHLIQVAGDKDITLHVSASNEAMLLYQKFGFKPEEFIKNFYIKYYPDDPNICKHAFFMRLIMPS